MAGNVKLSQFKKIDIPVQAQREDRGYNACKEPLLKLADPSDSTTWKNDVSLVFMKCDTLNVFTIKDGVKEAALGVELDFVNDNDTQGFVIDWRQYYDGSNNLIAGCYKVFIECEIEGISFEMYHSVVNLLPYTTQTSEGTVRINSIFNDYSDALGINFTGSGAQDTVRFRGFFGKRQPNMTIENITLTDREVNKVYNEARPTYSLICDPTTYCTTYWVEQIHLLHANVMYISDYNAYNHTEFKEFPVILNDEEGPEYDYFDGTGTNKAKIIASFKEKIANKKSKYETDLNGSSIPDIGLWQGIACPLDPTVEISLNETPTYTVNCGASQNINLLDSNGDTVTVVSVSGDNITLDITPTPPPSASYLLDSYSSEGGYSMRKISSTATNCIRVRRSNDNAEQDIGFVCDELDTTALLDFVGANDGFVTTWYDQSGNSRDAVNATAATQPRIVLGGVLETKNTKPAIYFNDDWLKYSGQVVPLATNPFSYFTVSSHETANDLGLVFKTRDIRQDSGGTYIFNAHDRRTDKLNLFVKTLTNHYANLSVQRDNSNYTLLSGFVDSSNNMSAFDNGATGTTDTYSGTYTSDALIIGDTTTFSGSFQLVGHIGEIIILNTDESANRVAIETDINNYYTVF